MSCCVWDENAPAAEPVPRPHRPSLLAQAANVLVFTAAGLGRGDTAVIAKTAKELPEEHPDPLAQALVLTAIVISFGVLAFCLVLLKRTHRRTADADVDALARVES